MLAVGPSLEPVLEATGDLDVTVAYATRVRPFPAAELAAVAGTEVVLVEPYLAGTSAAAVCDALIDRPRRLLSIGITEPELRRYGTPADHRRAHCSTPAGSERSSDVSRDEDADRAA